MSNKAQELITKLDESALADGKFKLQVIGNIPEGDLYELKNRYRFKLEDNIITWSQEDQPENKESTSTVRANLIKDLGKIDLHVNPNKNKTQID